MAGEETPWTIRVEGGPEGAVSRIAKDLANLGYAVSPPGEEEGAGPVRLVIESPGPGPSAFWNSSAFVQSVLDQIIDPVLVCDGQGGVVLQNRAAHALLPLSGAPLSVPSEEPSASALSSAGETPLAPEEYPLYRALNGEEVVDLSLVARPAEEAPRELVVSARPVWSREGSVQGAVVVAREVTKERRWQRSLQQARDLYAALSETNQFLVSSPPPEDLFEAVSRIVVDYAGFRLAWIGLVGQDGWVYPRASHGQARSYVEDIRVSADPDREEGQGPTGICIRTGEHVISRRVLDDPHMGPWREVAEQYGLYASGAFPIRRNGEIIGALNVYSGEPDFLSEDLVHLLDEMVLDMSFALDNYDRNERLRQLAEIIEASPDFVGVADTQGYILYHNPAASRLLGEEALKSHIQATHPEWAARMVQEEALPRSRAEGTWHGETAFLDSHGREIPFSQIVIAHRNDRGEVVRYSTIARDISQWRQAEERIQHLAYQDSVTGAANRTHLVERLEREINRLGRSGRYGALLALDLDSFQVINDSMGLGVGDGLLRAVAERLTTLLRKEDLLARLGADEFVVLMVDLAETAEGAEAEAERVAERIRESFQNPFPAHDTDFHLSASMGLALFPEDSTDAESLLQRVGSALNAAKGKGRGSMRFFHPGMVSAVQQRLDLEQELRGAMNREDLYLAFQPIWDLEQGGISGLETLVRWNHPERGNISPGQFIPVAEQTGLIKPLGEWILEEALRTVGPWLKRGLELPMGLAVNISPQQFSGHGFVEGVSRTLWEHGFPAGSLKLEITESLLMQNLTVAVDKIHRLRELGVTFAVDDFGTGYSSLAYLDQLPLEALKIDRSFVSRVDQEQSPGRIIEAVLAMAYGLDLSVVGEGIETESQRLFLKNQGCGHGQGFLLSKPMPAKELERLYLSGYASN